MTDRTALVPTIVAVILVGVLVAPIAVGPVSGGDNAATYQVIVDPVDADPGDEVTATVEFSSHGGYDGGGVGSISGSLTYDDVLSVSDVEIGTFFDRDGADVDLTVDHGDGHLTFEQIRQPTADGTTGSEPILTVTFTVAEDADPANAVIDVDHFEALLYNGHQQFTYDHSMQNTVYIAGGVEEPEDTDEAVDGVTFANDGTTDDHSDSGDDNAASDGEPIPGFGVLAVLASLAALGAVGRWWNRGSRR